LGDVDHDLMADGEEIMAEAAAQPIANGEWRMAKE
jgi:hypothetical protein